jgi:RNA polymerase sigma-70 factor (ECF subfamily)
MMTRTRSIDRIRARQARPAIAAGDTEPILQRQRDPAPGPEATALTLDVAARVRVALGELTDVQRRALELAYFEGLSQSDIAERLREPLGTVKTRIRTALQKLRAVMERG